MAVCQVDQAFRKQWRGQGNVASISQVPDLRAGFQVLFSHLTITIEDDLRSTIRRHDHRCRPRGNLAAAINPPNLLASFQIQNGDKVRIQAVALNNDETVVNNRGTGKAPFQFRGVVRSGHKFSEIVFPDQSPIEVKTVKARRAKECDDIFSIGGRSAVGMRGLQVPLDGWRTDMSVFGPQHHPRFKLQTLDLPCPFARIRRRLSGPTRPTGFDGWILSIRVDCCCQEDTITPDYRR